MNLANNELRHPQLDEIIAGFYATAEISLVTRYPYWPSALTAVARHFSVTTEEVSISAGSDQAIRALARLAAVAGRRMILQWPNYATYQIAAASEGLAVERVQTVGYSPEEELKALCAATRRPGKALVVLTNPHGITGRLLTPDLVAALAAACEEEGHLLVLDEAYVWFAAADHVQLLRRFPNLLLLRSFSKGFGMAGLRFAAMLSSPGIIAYVNRARCAAEISGLAVAFVEHCLAQQSTLRNIWEDIARRRDETAQTIANLNTRWSCPSSAANFQLVDTGTAASAEHVTVGLRERGIRVRSLAEEPTLASCFRYAVCGDSSTKLLIAAASELAVTA